MSYTLFVCKDGTVTYNKTGSRSFNGAALPVLQVETESDAKFIQVAICKAQYGEHPLMPGKPWYRIWDFSGRVEDLDIVAKTMKAVLEARHEADAH